MTFQEALNKAYWKNSGICYSRAAFYEKADAEEFSKLVIEEGNAANGGMFHGMKLGAISHYQEFNKRNGERMRDHEYWEVTY